MDFTKGKVYYHKADGRRLVCLSAKTGLFRYVDYKGKYLEGEFRDYEVDEMMPELTNYKPWSLGG